MPYCREALERFSSVLGAAGDLALLFCALGGVYIGGGLCKRLGALLDVARLRESFVAKGRFADYLERIPIYLVTRRDPGLLGRRPTRCRLEHGAAACTGRTIRFGTTPSSCIAGRASRGRLELQARHGLDVNLVLLCCWLASRGVAADEPSLGRIAAAAASWQEAFVRPLRAVRRRLKADLADPRPDSIPARWPELTSGCAGAFLLWRSKASAWSSSSSPRSSAISRPRPLREWRSRAPICVAAGALLRPTGRRSPSCLGPLSRRSGGRDRGCSRGARALSQTGRPLPHA